GRMQAAAEPELRPAVGPEERRRPDRVEPQPGLLERPPRRQMAPVDEQAELGVLAVRREAVDEDRSRFGRGVPGEPDDDRRAPARARCDHWCEQGTAEDGEFLGARREVAVQAREEAGRAEVLLPEPATAVLQLGEPGRREPLVEAGDELADSLDVGAIDPDAVGPPVDEEVVREHAVGVDEDRDPAERERLVEPPGPVADAARAEGVVAGDEVLDVLPADLRPARFVDRRVHRAAAALAPEDDADVDRALADERLERARTNEHVLRVRPGVAGERAPHGRAPRPLLAQRDAAEAHDRPARLLPNGEPAADVVEQVVVEAGQRELAGRAPRPRERRAEDGHVGNRERLGRVAFEEDGDWLAGGARLRGERVQPPDAVRSLGLLPVLREDRQVAVGEPGELEELAAARDEVVGEARPLFAAARPAPEREEDRRVDGVRRQVVAARVDLHPPERSARLYGPRPQGGVVPGTGGGSRRPGRTGGRHPGNPRQLWAGPGARPLDRATEDDAPSRWPRAAWAECEGGRTLRPAGG